MASVLVIVMCLMPAASASASGRPVQGQALLQEQAVQMNDAAGRKTPSMSLIAHMFGGSVNSIEQALKAVKRNAARQEPAGDDEVPGAEGGMSDWLKSRLLPQAQQTQVAMQGEVDRVLKTIKDCEKVSWTAEQSMQHREKLLEGDEAEKFKCLAEEHQLHLSKRANCEELNEYANGLSQPDTLTDTDHTDRDAVKATLRENFNFFNNAADQFANLYKECEKAELEASAEDKKCDADEEVVKEFYCHLKSGRDKACVAYGACFDAKKAIYDDVVAHVKVMEAENKEHFKKLACSAFNSESIENDIDPDCAATANTAHLDVAYGDELTPAACPELVKTSQNYTGIKCFADGSVDKTGEVAESSNSTKTDAGADKAKDAGTSAGNATAAKEESAAAPAPAGNSTDAGAAAGNATK